MAERRDLVRGVSGRYRRSSKKEKGRILDEFVKMTGYNRIYAVWLLNQQGRKVRVNRRLVVVVGEAGSGAMPATNAMTPKQNWICSMSYTSSFDYGHKLKDENHFR